MLLDVGRLTRRHVTSGLFHSRLLHLARAFNASAYHLEETLPYLQPRDYKPGHPNPAAGDIAVLGGGITGLTSAYELARHLPDANIVLYEKSGRLGGWIDSEVVPVDGGEVLFEWGPRSFRPALKGSGFATANLISRLTDADSQTGRKAEALVGASKIAPASRNRFIYYPDHLVRMPSFYGSFLKNFMDLFRSVVKEDIWKDVLPGVAKDMKNPARAADVQDESVGDFLTRRFGSAATDNMASAFFHGIYAGDIYKLSARTLLPSFWYGERRHHNAESVILDLLYSMMQGRGVERYENVKLALMLSQLDTPTGLPDMLRSLSEMTFATWVGGMSWLTRSLRHYLEELPNVTIKLNTEVDSLVYNPSKSKLLVSNDKFDYVVSSLPPRTMSRIMNDKRWNLDAIDKSVTVMVVNLYYQPDGTLPDVPEGFGYLLPRSLPTDQNPERALGVIFGHHCSGDQGKDATITISREEISGSHESWQKNIDNAQDKINGLEKLNKSHKNKTLTQVIKTQLKDIRDRQLKNQEKLDTFNRGEGQDPKEIIHRRVGQDTVEGMKFTVMLGGHWWEGWEESDYPSEEKAIDMARTVLRRHLNITDAPAVAKARLNRECIPQYPVGYRKYMADINEKVLEPCEGRLKLAGPWYQGAVGVNDCISSATQMSLAVRDGWDHVTGLDQYTRDEVWVIKDNETLSYRPDTPK